jgi:hypothetical protein
MTDEEVFASITAQLASDRTWARRVKWIALRSRLCSFCLRAISSSAPAAGTWVMV